MARKGFTSTKPPSMAAPGSFLPREGVFIGELIGAQLYWSSKFGEKNNDIAAREGCDLNLGLIFAVQDPDSDNDPMEDDAEGRYRHVESFIRLHVDKDGNFGPGGGRAKANKILTALNGESFDPFDSDFEFGLYGAGLEKYDDIYEVPHITEYDKGEEWLALTEVIINGKNLIGQSAQFQFGNAEKPDGGKSEKITIISAMPMPKTGSGKKKSASLKSKPATKGSNGNGTADIDTPLDPEPPAAPTSDRVDLASMPKSVQWVLKRLAAEPMSIPEKHWLPFLQHFTEDSETGPVAALEDLSRDDALKFQGLHKADDGDQLAEMYREWARDLALAGKKAAAVAPADDDGDEFDDEDDAPPF